MMKCAALAGAAIAAAMLAACQNGEGAASDVAERAACDVELFVLGAGQDASAPQIGYHQDRAWDDASLELLATSLAIVDHRIEARYLFEATPNISRQLKLLDELAPTQKPSLGLSGIFLTHAHIGHYAGLMFLGREAAGAKNLPVYAMPRMAKFLQTNGPWEQLVELGNIDLKPLENHDAVRLSPSLIVTPFQVPHRDEYSETVGYFIENQNAKALFIPDIDSWDAWSAEFETNIDEVIADVDYAFLDSTFYSDSELPGRDMSLIPHPRVSDMMDRFDVLSAEERAKINFIHMNHTNPIRYRDSPQSNEVKSRGYNIARRGDSHCLD